MGSRFLRLLSWRGGCARLETDIRNREHTETELLASARSGDERAFEELTLPHRRELHVHCYRMLGSLHDTDDALQETLLRAWRGLDRFEPRAPFMMLDLTAEGNLRTSTLRAFDHDQMQAIIQRTG